MKKIIMLVLIIFTSLLVIHPRVSATQVSYNLFETTNINLSYQWSVGSAQLVSGQPIDIDFDDSNFTVNTYMLLNGVTRKVFTISNAKYISQVKITASYSDAVVLARYYFAYGENDSVMILKDIEGNIADLGNHKGDNMWIYIAMNSGLTYDETRAVHSNTAYHEEDYFSLMVSYNPIVIDPDPEDPSEQVSQLPNTQGSIFDNYNQMGEVTWTIDGYDATFQILYNGVYQLNYTFNSSTDMSIFEESSEAYYYSYEGQKFIVFNHGDESMFDERNFRTKTFVPYTIWNLSTNQLSTIDEFNVYIYVREESGNNLYAYFYVDEFVIEHLLSATISMQYRYVPYIGSKGDWQPYFKVLEAGNINPGSISWQLQAAAISSTATLIGMAIPGLQLPALIIGTPVTAALMFLSYDQLIDGEALFTGSIEEIAEVTAPTTSLVNEINGALSEQYDAFQGINLSSFTLWKLHLGTFNKAFQQGVEVNMEEDPAFNIVQFRYQTDGQVYTMTEEDYNVVFVPGALEEKDVLISIPEGWTLERIGTIILVLVGGYVALKILPALDKGAGSLINIIRNPKKLIVIGLIILVVLYLSGVISI